MEIFKHYFEESFSESGTLNSLKINCPDNFNFAYDIVDGLARTEPERRAMLWCNPEGEERTFTFDEISKLSNKAANVFLAHGVKKGDKVMLILKRHYQYWYVVLGLHKIGAVAIPATHLLTEKDIIYRVDSADVSTVVCTSDGQVSDFIADAERECKNPFLKFIVKSDRDGFVNFDKEIETAPDTLERIENDKSDPILLYFTSGTTAYPKMVVHDHSYPLAHYLTAKHWQNIDPNGLHVTLSDTGWAKASWGKLYGQWIVGTAVFVFDYEKFNPAELLGVFAKYRITTICAPPTMVRYFAKTGIENFDLSALQYACVAGEALNPEVYKIFYEKKNIKLMEGFGQTETTLCIANLVGEKNVLGSMGKPTPLYDVRLVDGDNNEVGVGEVGEIAIKLKDGENIGIFKGYYKDKEQTDAVFYGGYYHTGDTASRDEEGYIWYVGRKDDIIKSSGYRIGPFEIESVLMEHPAVLECAITGIPDEERGQLIKATIILTSSYTASDELAKELQDFVKKRTAPYKYPRVIEFSGELPKTISGKIRRVEIREKDAAKKPEYV